jgi:hypothetical protein
MSAAHAIADGPPPRKYTNTERLALPRLKNVHDDVEKLSRLRRRLLREHGSPAKMNETQRRQYYEALARIYMSLDGW